MTVHVGRDTDVLTLKAILEAETGVTSHNQALVFGNRLLDDRCVSRVSKIASMPWRAWGLLAKFHLPPASFAMQPDALCSWCQRWGPHSNGACPSTSSTAGWPAAPAAAAGQVGASHAACTPHASLPSPLMATSHCVHDCMSAGAEPRTLTAQPPHQQHLFKPSKTTWSNWHSCSSMRQR